MPHERKSQRAPSSTLSRRHVLHGARCRCWCGRSRDQGPGRRPLPARGAAEHHHHAAARLRPGRRADHLFLGPRRHRGRPELQRPRAAERADPAAVDRRAVGRRAGVERAGALSGVERHSEQPADALARGRRPRQRVPHAVEQQQRQHVRFPGPAALLRAPHAARGALRARRLGRPSSPTRSRASGSTRRTTSCRIPTAATGSPIRPMAASSTKARRMSPAARATRRPAQSAHRPAAGHRRRPARAADQLLSRRSERARRPRRHARTRCPIRTGCASRPTTRSSTSPAPARARATRGRAARATSTCSMSAPTTSCRTASCSPTAWSTA